MTPERARPIHECFLSALFSLQWVADQNLMINADKLIPGKIQSDLIRE